MGQDTPEKIADLRMIDLDELLRGDEEAIEELFKSARCPGFFHLRTNEKSSYSLSQDAAPLYQIFSRYFGKPSQVKAKHTRSEPERGYKCAPGFESFEIASDELASPAQALPDMTVSEVQQLTEFARKCDNVTKSLLKILLSKMEGSQTDRIREAHFTNKPSSTSLKAISAPTSALRSEAPDTTHTDGGTLTLLWCDHLSSQIMDPRTNAWSWCEPREGCTLVNVATSLQRESDGLFHSCVHRVTQPSDGAEERLFLSYYLRPSDV